VFVEITDVFLRDGLQDEHVIVPTDAKLAVAAALADAGVPRIEAGSFVNPARVPQMRDAAELFARRPADAVPWTALALNGKGIARAVDAGARQVAIVASASRAHSTANAGRTTAEALADIAEEVARQRDAEDPVVFFAGISTAFTCPFEGEIPAERVAEVVHAFLDMGVRDIGLADTLGNTPTDRLMATVRHVRDAAPEGVYSLHLHNALGQALDTATAAVEEGIVRFDAALGGYGGCPFAPGAAGNLDTLALVTHLHALGHDTGIDPDRLAEAVDLAHRVVREAPALA
jgi:hydroxymethylglutaryl-CoA lyase